MKNSVTQPAEANPALPEPCSENTCATCFENRGCFYEHYPAVVFSITEDNSGNEGAGSFATGTCA